MHSRTRTVFNGRSVVVRKMKPVKKIDDTPKVATQEGKGVKMPTEAEKKVDKAKLRAELWGKL